MAPMNLAMHVETLRDQLVVAAEMGGAESKSVVERLSAGLEAATRLVLLETLSAAADEITADLAPGAVEVRLRGSDPYFVVTLPSDPVSEVGAVETTPLGVIPQGGEEGGTSRLNLRLPEALKGRIEEAARRDGLSLNAWLVRAAAAAAERPQGQMPRTPSGSHRYTGWVR
jgi:HicB family